VKCTGVDRAVITLWLGHESVETAQIYLEATPAMKEHALAKTSPPHGGPGRYRAADQPLSFSQQAVASEKLCRVIGSPPHGAICNFTTDSAKPPTSPDIVRRGT
jgi:hypothetical protein